MGRKVNVIQDPDQPVDKDVLAKAIVDVAEAMRRLQRSGLNKKAIVVLVSHDAKVPQGTVKVIMESLEFLAATYTK